jgi:hypothetical protein
MSDNLVPLLVATLFAVLFYRRARRLFGRQRVRTRRFMFRIAVVGSIGGLILFLPWAPWWGHVLGPALGLVLAAIGIATTRTEHEDGDWYYTPNTLLGLGVLSLLVARVVYRFLTMGNVADGFRAGQMPTPSPIGKILILVVLTYAAVYHAGILGRCSPRNA